MPDFDLTPVSYDPFADQQAGGVPVRHTPGRQGGGKIRGVRLRDVGGRWVSMRDPGRAFRSFGGRRGGELGPVARPA